MDIISDKNKIREMFWECIFSQYYYKTLSEYELEKVYVYAMGYLHEITEPSRAAFIAYRKKQKVNKNAKFKQPPPHDYEENIQKLIDQLSTIVGSKSKIIDEPVLKEIEIKQDLPVENNSHLNYNKQIFKTDNSFLLFETLLKEFEFEIKRTPLAYISFIYWQMMADRYLYDISPKVFRTFLEAEPFNIFLDKLKTKIACTTANKIKGYSICKAQFPL